jgi:hypothetical protein
MLSLSVHEIQMAGGAGLCPSVAHVAAPNTACVKEGAHGGTLGSPVLEPVREPASA